MKTRFILPAVTSIHSIHISKGAGGRPSITPLKTAPESLAELSCFRFLLFAMSWDSYIDNLLGHAAGHADKAAIIGLDGGAPWTTAHNGLGLVFQGQEAVDIARVLKSGDFSPFQVRPVIQRFGIAHFFAKPLFQIRYFAKKVFSKLSNVSL